MVDRASITDDTPLRLSVAAELAFPQGGMAASGLRKEAMRGRLAIERIAGKDYTTLRAIDDMRKLCRVVPKDQDSGSNPREMGGRRSGSSATEPSSEALAQARAKLQKLKAPSETTSTKKPRRAPATVTRLRSVSPTS